MFKVLCWFFIQILIQFILLNVFLFLQMEKSSSEQQIQDLHPGLFDSERMFSNTFAVLSSCPLTPSVSPNQHEGHWNSSLIRLEGEGSCFLKFLHLIFIYSLPNPESCACKIIKASVRHVSILFHFHSSQIISVLKKTPKLRYELFKPND